MAIELRRYAFVAALLAALLGGCATQPTRSVDVDALLNAIELDDAATVRNIVQSAPGGANLSVPAPGYSDGAPVITLAGRDASVNVLRYLIAAGADIDARTPVGETAVMLAAYFPNGSADTPTLERHYQAVKLLVDSGANVENDEYNYTALSYAAYHGRRRIIEYLLAHGARADGVVLKSGITYANTPLMMAAIQGHYDVVVELLRAGANPAIREYRGRTAAQFAVKYKHDHIATLLQCAQRTHAIQQMVASCR